MKSVSRMIIFSATTLALTVACVDEKKKPTAVPQKPGSAAPGKPGASPNDKAVDEANKAARAKTPTKEELENLSGNWQVTQIDGDEDGLNPLLAGKALGAKDSKPVIQLTLDKERIKITHNDAGVTFFRADQAYKIEGKLLAPVNTPESALPEFEFNMTDKDKLTLKGYGSFVRASAKIRRDTRLGQAVEKIPVENKEKLYTYTLTRIAEQELVKTNERNVKMEMLLKSADVNLDSRLTSKTAGAPAGGSIRCMISKTPEGTKLSIGYFRQAAETAGELLPTHMLGLAGNAKFDLNKESESIEMILKPTTSGMLRVGKILTADKTHHLLIEKNESCTLRMNRNHRAATFNIKCTKLAIAEVPNADTKTANAEADLDLSAPPQNSRPAELTTAIGECILQLGRSL